MSIKSEKIKKNNKKIQKLLKIIFDYILSIISLIIFSPVLIITTVLIKLDSKGPVFYLQERAGKDKKIFKIIKVRTMVDGAGKKGAGFGIENNDPRITKIGKFMRKYSIDELPQLFNILKGEMSFVGPRPGLPYQAERYNDEQKKRLEVKPGITGLAQVKGRGTIPWSKRIEYDISYIENWSFFQDIKILFLTAVFVLLRRGYSEEQDAQKIEDF
jgi:lipopolysaccharide/colanic/teichoic acid biosynthesis glycosyltransferase